MQNESITWNNIPEHMICAAFPDAMRDLMRLVPLSVLLLILEGYGGTRLYIPIHPQPNDALSKMIGIDAAKVLASYMGGDSLDVPRLVKAHQHARNAAVMDSLSRGATMREAARAFGLTTRHVRNIKNCYSHKT